MTEIVITPFSLTYDGNEAKRHAINSRALGESIIGASRLYTAVAHYCAFGIVPKGNYRKEFICYAQPSKDGCYEQWLFLAVAAQEYNLHGEIYSKAITHIFSLVVGAIKRIWTRKGDTEKVVETLAEVLKEHAKHDADVQMQLVNAMTHANDNLASLHSKMIDTLPRLAAATRNHGRQLVAPVGNTCASLTQFSHTHMAVVIEEPDAEVIRGDTAMEVDEMQNFNCKRITEVNIQTGHCILTVEGFDRPVIGKISDPVISTPNNVYTKALNDGTSLQISAKPVKKDGHIHRLFISDAHP